MARILRQLGGVALALSMAGAGTWLGMGVSAPGVASAVQDVQQSVQHVQRGHNGRIVFASDRTGSYEIYSAAPSGKGVQRLTNDSEIQLDPAWAANANKIVYTQCCSNGDFDIYSMNANGSGQTRLTTRVGADVEPSYSRTGKIAFSGARNGQYDIFVMNGDGSNLHPITANAADDLEPTWSPNGKRIAFSSTRSGHGDIYTMSPTGKNLTKATSSGGIDKQPAWSPSGKSIVFSSLREQNPKIYVTSAGRGGKDRRITSGGGPDTDPAWSPDGKHIVYDHGEGGHTGKGFDLFITSPRGGHPHRITDDVKSYEIKPDWARK